MNERQKILDLPTPIVTSCLCTTFLKNVLHNARAVSCFISFCAEFKFRIAFVALKEKMFNATGEEVKQVWQGNDSYY